MWIYLKGLFTLIISGFLIFSFISKNSEIYPSSSGYKNTIFFEEISYKMGLDDYEHIGLFPLTKHENRDFLANVAIGIPPSITVMDINRDDFPDLYITYPISGKENVIYINKKGKSFARSKEYLSIKNVNKEFSSIHIAWFDFNNDGYEDIFVARYGCHSLYIYEPLQKDYIAHPKAVSYCSNPWGINIVDFNKDSYMDLVFANHYKSINLNKEWARVAFRGDDKFGGENMLLINHRGKHFLEDKSNVFKYKDFSTTVGISDINNDSWPDIFIANDAIYDRLYLNVKGSLKEITFSWMKKEKHGFSGMNSDFADLNNDLLPDLYVSNIFNPPYEVWFNSLWINDSGQRFIEKAESFKIHKCGFSWGAKFADFNNDGYLDLVVGNGFYRGSQAKPGQSDDRFYSKRWHATSPLFRDKLYKSFQNDSSLVQDAGFQKTCLFENRGGKEFSYISEQANIKGFYNSRSTIILDFNNDGKMDFLTGNYNDKIQLYKNISQTQGNWVGFDIRNTEGAIALGAKVILTTHAGRKFMREIYPYNGFGGQNDWRIHFGIGEDQPKTLEIQYRDKTRFVQIKRVNEYIKIKI